ncbi:hypothetical protein QC762_308180 [Podospora pseudocomata]|uniref:Carboxylesterase family protein n=1 Tax=Podospora pseudocomata TaxID=2093779 RepID=A0ABR0GK16_9PEZI|nr:hypothetical protein QC762_308180 [Podospora pseudocomata]
MMATTTSRHRSSLDFDIHTDHSHLSQKANLPLGNKFAVLSDIHNLNSLNIDSLARDLGSLHLEYSSKEGNCQQGHKARDRRVRLSVDNNIEYDHPFFDKHRVISATTNGSETTVASDDFKHNNPLAQAEHRLPNNLEQIRKHQEGQFEWLLTIPLPFRSKSRRRVGNRSLGDSHDGEDQESDLGSGGGGKNVLFGCNLIHHRTQSDGASVDHGGSLTNRYTLLATRVESEEEMSAVEQSVVVEEADSSVVANVSQEGNSTVLRGGEENLQPEGQEERPKSVLSIKVGESLMGMEHLSPLPSPQPARPLSRIEDSVEELDKLEEELEALNEVAQLERVVSPELATEPVLESIPEAPVQPQPSTSTRRASTIRASTTTTPTTHTTTRTRSTAERSSSVRKSTSASLAREDDKPASTSKTAANTSTARRSIARPSSLLPPKATVKSSRAPTVPAFELPGEAVARRLKEQRAARLSQQVSAEEAAAIAAQFSPSKPHAKSSKPLTRPTFELPGEVISRRKREEREARLKAQEEEEKKRREFKARPIRASVIGSSGGNSVRETATSRARQARMEAGGQATTPTHTSTATAPTSASAARMRHSIAVTGGGYASSTVAASTRSAAAVSLTTTTATTTRGRTSLAAPSAGGAGSSSRGTSATSAASSSGKRSSTTTTVSQEDVQQQKMRGKEIFKRDNSFTLERERERKEREQAAKMAREQAAERSRALGREWKEKMAVRQKRASLMISGSGGESGGQGY